MLVHDLDLRVVRVSDGTSYFPWLLDPSQPDVPAVTGDNSRDNVEQVHVAAPDSGVYHLIVTHKGSLTESQPYSLVQSGLAFPPPVAPEVHNLVVAQRRDGSGLVDIHFDVVDPDSPLVTVTVSASSDGGVTWDLAMNSISGDVGAGVATGVSKTIMWDFAQDHPDLYLPACVFKVTVDDE
jgi:hypothetical protein